jgi:hypothetical protein
MSTRTENRSPIRYRAAGVTALNFGRILVILVGVPLLLSKVVGWPFPTVLPSFSTFKTTWTTRDYDPKILLKAVSIVVWISWALALTSVILQVWGQVRSARVPRPKFIPKRLFAATNRWVSGISFGSNNKIARSRTAPLPIPNFDRSVKLQTDLPSAQDHLQAPIVERRSSRSEESDGIWTGQFLHATADQTLFEVAEQIWGSEASKNYPALLAENREVIGNADNLLIEGTVLRIPGAGGVVNDRRRAEPSSESFARPVPPPAADSSEVILNETQPTDPVLSKHNERVTRAMLRSFREEKKSAKSETPVAMKPAEPSPEPLSTPSVPSSPATLVYKGD